MADKVKKGGYDSKEENIKNGISYCIEKKLPGKKIYPYCIKEGLPTQFYINANAVYIPSV